MRRMGAHASVKAIATGVATLLAVLLVGQTRQRVDVALICAALAFGATWTWGQATDRMNTAYLGRVALALVCLCNIAAWSLGSDIGPSLLAFGLVLGYGSFLFTTDMVLQKERPGTTSDEQR